jgi:hypothetical protein
MSSLVLTGQRSLASLQYGYDTLRTRYGINVVVDDVVALDPAARGDAGLGPRLRPTAWCWPPASTLTPCPA